MYLLGIRHIRPETCKQSLFKLFDQYARFSEGDSAGKDNIETFTD